MPTLPATTARVPVHTSDKVNQQIYQQLEDRLVQLVARRGDVDSRLEALNYEWDTERIVEVSSGAFALVGALLGVLYSGWFHFMPFFVAVTLLPQALLGWCPSLPVLRSLGVRTSNEIDTERYALKAIRGDFDEIDSSGIVGREDVRRLLSLMGRNYKAARIGMPSSERLASEHVTTAKESRTSEHATTARERRTASEKSIPKETISFGAGAEDENFEIPLSKETLHISKSEENQGEVRLRKVTHTETINQPVELHFEDVVVERAPRGGQGDAAFTEQLASFPISAERPVVTKETEAAGAVRLRKVDRYEKVDVNETVRAEDVEVETDMQRSR